MARGILGGFGPESSQPQKPRATSGGVMPGESKDVMNYSPPWGPKNIMDPKSPGIHGENHMNEQKQNSGGRHSGRPGIGGTVRKGGSQGCY